MPPTYLCKVHKRPWTNSCLIQQPLSNLCLCAMAPTHNLHICNLHSHSPHPLIPCLFPECNRWFKMSSGLTYHRQSKHPAVGIDIEDSESSDTSCSLNSSGHSVHDLVCFYWLLHQTLYRTKLQILG